MKNIKTPYLIFNTYFKVLSFIWLSLCFNLNAQNTTRYEVEDAELIGVTIDLDNDQTGFSGSGYTDQNSFDEDTDKITFAVNVTETDTYELIIGYGGFANSDKWEFISINGAANVYTAFPQTATWSTINFGDIQLNAGENTIEITKSWGYTTFDYIDVKTISTEPQYLLTVNDGTGSGSYEENEVVNIVAVPPDGYMFNFWSGDTGNVSDINNGTTTVSMPAQDITINANFTLIPTYTLNVNEGEGSGNYIEGETVVISANSNIGYLFNEWSGDVSNIANVTYPTTSLIMPNEDINITATYINDQQYTLTVNSGSGSGDYFQGEEINIIADAPPAGKMFDKWVGDISGILNINFESTTYKTQEFNAEITATYRDINAPLSMNIATNFWFFASWSGETPMIQNSEIDWNTAYTNDTNIWNPEFIDDLSIYKALRFMDWSATNNNNFSDWNLRLLPTDPNNHPSADAIGSLNRGSNKPGLSYEWMIDLCNRTNTDLWITVPHQTKNTYWNNLATLIAQNLNPDLKCYIEYSNETWNSLFSQNDYINDQGVLMDLPGINQYYKGGSYHVYISFQLYEEFESVFAQENRADDLVKVMSVGGNIDMVRQAMRDNLPVVNPLNQWPDAWAIAPYIGNGQNGADPLIFEKASAELASQIDPTNGGWGNMGPGRVIEAKQLADEFNLRCITYEGGMHQTQNSEEWATNPEIYTHYTNMLHTYSAYFDLFTHYTQTSTYTNAAGQGSWGAKEFTGQPIADAHKYRALSDWTNSFTLSSVDEYDTDLKHHFKIFPNPAKSKFMIKWQHFNPYQVTLSNLLGKVLLEKKGFSNQIEIDTLNFNKGMYIVTIKSNNTSTTKKIIIN